MLHGSMTALITPFRNGGIDEQAFAALVERQIQNGVNVLVPCGTTGESATLSHDEHRRVVALCVEIAAGRAPVIAGAGSNSTTEAIDLMRHAKEIGADVVIGETTFQHLAKLQASTQIFKEYSLNLKGYEIPIVAYGLTFADLTQFLQINEPQNEVSQGYQFPDRNLL
jgi:4-hydroxy-tetrahydrodipicolinate synthase